MADIAQIGFAADSSGLVAAEQALNRLTPAAQRTEAAAAGAAGAMGATSAAAAGVAAASNNTVRVLSSANGALVTQAANVNKVNDAYKKLADTQKRINDLTGVNGRSDNASRAADVKAYGDELDRLRSKFNPLFAAGQQYKAVLNEINMAHRVGAISQKEQQKAIEAAKASFVGQVNTIRNVRNATAGLSWEAKNLSFQMVDVTQGVLSGISPMQIFAQQAGQIGQVLATSEKGAKGLFSEIGSAISRVLTPMRILTLGLIGAGIGAVYAINSVISSSRAIDDLARSTDQATSRLRELQQSMQKRGISPEEFAAGFKTFSDEVYNAQRNMGSLNGLMIANGQTARTNQEYFARVADLVARTVSDVQKQKILEAAGLPTSRQWVEYMSLGAAGIEAASKATIKFNDSAEQNMIKKAKEFDEAWNRTITNFTNYFKSSVVSIIGFLSDIKPPSWLNNVGTALAQSIPVLGQAITVYRAAKGLIGSNATAAFADRFGEFNSPGNASSLRASMINKAAGNPNQPKTRDELLTINQQAQSRIAILGELATVEDIVAAKQLELNAAFLNGVGPTEKQAAAIINATRATAEMNRVNQQAQIGIFNVDQAQKAASDTLQMWIDKGLVNKNDTEQMAAAQLVLSRNIKQTADAAAVAAAPLQQLRQLELDSSNLTKVLDTGLTGALSGLVSPIQDVLNGVTSIGDGFKNMGIIVLKAVQEMIIKMLILAPIARALRAAFGGFLGGGGSPADALTAGIAPLARGGMFSHGGLHAFASGGAFTNGIYNQPTPFMFAGGSKFGVMGEAGAEAVMPLRRGPNGSLGVQMFGASHSNDNSQMSIAYSPSYHLGGNVTQDDLNEVKKLQARDRKEFVQRVANAIPEIRKRGARV